jgi:hypothetical protein
MLFRKFPVGFSTVAKRRLKECRVIPCPSSRRYPVGRILIGPGDPSNGLPPQRRMSYAGLRAESCCARAPQFGGSANQRAITCWLPTSWLTLISSPASPEHHDENCAEPGSLRSAPSRMPAYLDQTAGLRVNASVVTGLRSERENQVIGFSRLD